MQPTCELTIIFPVCPISPTCFTSVVETESLLPSLALFFLAIKFPQFSVEGLGFSLLICNRGILEDKKTHKNCVSDWKKLII